MCVTILIYYQYYKTHIKTQIKAKKERDQGFPSGPVARSNS